MTATVGVANGKTDIQLTPRDFKGLSEPDWCPGCGDFGVLNAMHTHTHTSILSFCTRTFTHTNKLSN